MNILKAYANAADQGWNMPMPSGDREERKPREHKSSGDTLTISNAARSMLNGDNDTLSFCPQDATYDNKGYVMRQVENLQGDLRNLANHLMASPDNSLLAGQIQGMRRQLAGIHAMV